tara:strand:+ start:3454 stop:4110 length:657 start_codon:yes stop_codon:yes gene_type:complete
MNFPNLESNLEGVCNLIQILRSEDGCPWDQEQTSNSLTKHLIEESYELVEAIENHDLENIEEEIGDLLLNLSYQIVFLKEKKYSNESTLIKKLFNKIHTRHPHVFSDLKLKGSAAVEKNWQKIKSDSNKSNADSIPKYLPSLYLAQKIQKKYTNSDFESESDALLDIKRIINEKETLNTDILGELLYKLSNYARLTNVDPEQTLKKYINDLMDLNNEK